MLNPSRMLAAAVAILLVTGAASARLPIIKTKTGLVSGKTDGTNSIAYLGIPFGAPTNGSLRFMAPQPRAPWDGVLNATTFGPGCYQTHHNPDVPAVLSEDCLYLNIWTPADATTSSSLPVMVFIHGGSFAEGSNQGPFQMYSGKTMASHHNVVVVTIQYRLSALGWLVVPGTDVVGNQGLQDQELALKWLQANIAAFGGNPNSVTLWGESAGAMSVGIHLLTKREPPLFHKAIMESDVSGYRYRDTFDGGLYGAAFCEALNCMVDHKCSLSCMQAANVSAVGHAWNTAGNKVGPIVAGNWGHWLDAFLDWIPYVGAPLLPILPQEAWRTGNYSTDIPILIGTNQNEGATFIYAGVKSSLPTFLVGLAVDAIYGDHASAVRDYYKGVGSWPSSSTADGRPLLSEILTDYWFRCPSQKWANRTDGGAVYVYHYDHVLSSSSVFSSFGLPAICQTLVCHATELPIVFSSSNDQYLKPLNVSFTPDEVRMEQEVVAMWTTFARTGSPNNNTMNTPHWPAFNFGKRPSMLIRSSHLQFDNSTQLCGFWDQLGYDF